MTLVLVKCHCLQMSSILTTMIISQSAHSGEETSSLALVTTGHRGQTALRQSFQERPSLIYLNYNELQGPAAIQKCVL